MQAQVKQGKGVLELMTEEHAHGLAVRVVQTPGHSVIEVWRAWSAMWAWRVEAQEHRTGCHLLLLNDDQFDARLRAGKNTTVIPATVPFP